MVLLNHSFQPWMTVLYLLGTTACTPNQVGTTLESFQPIKNLRNRQQQVILDAESQYKSARQRGDAFQICNKAELVASTYFYLQGNDSVGFQFWKSVEKKDCEAFQEQESRTVAAQAMKSLDSFQEVMKQPIN